MYAFLRGGMDAGMAGQHDSHWYDPFVDARTSSSLVGAIGSRGRLDLLVVEDHALTRRALELTLGHLGHLVFSADTLRDARQLLRGFAVDVVICDVALPDGDATDLIRHWPADVRRPPSLAISGVSEPGIDARCRQAGFDAFLPKPLDVTVLQRLIVTLAGGQR